MRIWLVAVVVLAAGCSGGSASDDVVLTSRLNRHAGFELCDAGAFACYITGRPPPLNEELLAVLEGRSFSAELVAIACEGKRLDFDAPDVDLVGRLGGVWVNPQDGFSSGLVCEGEYPPHELEDAQGRIAVVDGVTRSWHVTGAELSEITCAGTTYVRPTDNFIGAPTRDAAPERVRMPDGGVVELAAEVGVVLEVTDCSEETGTWRGIGGELDGESGPYRFVWDSIQLRLVLQRT